MIFASSATTYKVSNSGGMTVTRIIAASAHWLNHGNIPFHWQMRTTPHVTHATSTAGNPMLSSRRRHLPVRVTPLP